MSHQYFDVKQAEAEQSRLARIRHHEVEFRKVFVMFVLLFGGGLMIGADSLAVNIVGCVVCLFGFGGLEWLRERSNKYYRVLNSISRGMFSYRIGHELSEKAFWNDDEDRRHYEQVVNQLKKYHGETQ